LGGEAPRRHEEYVILTLNPAPPPHDAAAVLDHLVDQLEERFPAGGGYRRGARGAQAPPKLP